MPGERLDWADQPNPGDIDISVVVPAYLGARTIADCVAGIECATAGRRREIIVVDSSGDATAEILHRDFPSATVIVSGNRLTAGGARNRGVAAARGRLIFFTDQDCVVPVDWIDRLERHLAAPDVGAAGGSVGIRNPSNLSGCAVYFLEFLSHFPRRGAPTRNRNFLLGCNGGYKAEALRTVRFPDRTLAEDVLFSHELQRAGFGVVYDPRVEVKHQNREGWREFFRYNWKMGQSAAAYHQVLRRWWVRPFLRAPLLTFIAPAVILPSIAFDLVRSRWSYFLIFLLLSPMCLLGNLVWAAGFRRHVRETQANAVSSSVDESHTR
jgi:GT2 family glycosyltransferase